jgi:NTP pyrophosphatase (non-canonical NTP hydrolase)
MKRSKVWDIEHGPMTKEEALIRVERARQEAKWGEQNHDDARWLKILVEEVGELAKAMLEQDDAGVKLELVHVAAVAVAHLESIERRPIRRGRK